MNNTKIMIAPGKYIQGSNAIYEIGRHVSRIGKKALVIGGKRGLEASRDGRNKSFEERGVEQLEELFSGECCFDEIKRLSSIAADNGCDVVVGCGGGQVLDTAKVIAKELKVPVVIVPTVASNDAPCSALAAVYKKDEHVIDKWVGTPRNPDIVLVDTTIIAQSPSRMLAAGMGDALATWFEAEACSASFSKNVARGLTSETALSCAGLCYDLLMEYGLQAKIANDNKVATPALEKVVEANILLSGIGFESGGVAAAHSLQDSLNALEECNGFYHGEKIAFLTLVQLILEERPQETMEEVFDFCFKIGLPITFKDLNIDGVGKERMMEAVSAGCGPHASIHNHSFPVDENLVYNAMITADAMGQNVKKGLPIV